MAVKVLIKKLKPATTRTIRRTASKPSKTRKV